MSSRYQMWLTYNGETEKLRFPVLPTVINIKQGSQNKSTDIQGLGEVVIKKDPAAVVVSFGSFFPSTLFPGVQVENLTPPFTLRDKITEWQKSDKPVHFLVTGTNINLFCVIEDFSWANRGGDTDSVHYSISLKEYKEVYARQVVVQGAKAVVPQPVAARTDNRAPEKTYTVVPGDCLWNIAAKYLGDSGRYPEIAALNGDIIKNPSLIYPGQVLKLPA